MLVDRNAQKSVIVVEISNRCSRLLYCRWFHIHGIRKEQRFGK